MAEYTDFSVTAYRDELIVELFGTDDHGSFDVISYQFDYDNASRDIVVPKGAVDREHISAIETVLNDEGYQMIPVDH